MLDKIILAYRRGVQARLEGVSAACQDLVERVAIHDKPGALDLSPAH